MRKPRILRATEVPPEDQSIGSLCAYEIDENRVQVACRLSDAHFEIGQLAILEVDLAGEPGVSTTYIVDQFFMAYHAASYDHGLLIETGNIVHRKSGDSWQRHELKAEFLQEAFSVEGIDFVFGDKGEIFRFQAGAWSKDDTPTEQTILGMHGQSLNALVAVGEQGTLLRHSTSGWESIDLPTNVYLRTCWVSAKDSLLAGGDGGTLVEIRDQEFLPVDTGLEGDVLALCEYKGKIYVADSDFGVSLLENGRIEPVANLGYVYRLTAGKRWLTVDAGQYVFQFDGVTWRGFEISYRDGYRAELFDMASIGL